MNTDTSTLFAALGDPVRLQIIEQLSSGCELSAGEIAQSHKVSGPAISRHLKLLGQAGLIDARAQHRFRYYRLNHSRFSEAKSWFEYHLSFWENSLDRLDQMIKSENKESNRN